MRNWQAVSTGLLALTGLSSEAWAQAPAPSPMPAVPVAAIVGPNPGAAAAQSLVAKIQREEFEAKSRREAVRYLGTVDCRYWSGADRVLIAALRADCNEPVRFEAALALGNGCCCTKDTIEALLLAATGSDRDGNPVEASSRVRSAALLSLRHGVAYYSQDVPPEPKKPIAVDDAGVPLTAYYSNLRNKPLTQTLAEARAALANMAAPAKVAAQPSQRRPILEAFGLLFPPTVSPAHTNTATATYVVQARAPLTAEELNYRGPLLVQAVSTTDCRFTVNAAAPTSSPTPAAAPKTVVSRVAATQPSAEASAPSASEPQWMPAKPRGQTPQAQRANVSPAGQVSMARSAAPAPSLAALYTNTPSPATPGYLPPARAPAMTQPVSPRANEVNVHQLLLVLRNSIYPIQREWAVSELSNVYWRTNPDVVQALMSSARSDGAATVRVMCIRALAKMNVDTLPVTSAIETLKGDSDPRVEREAVVALHRLKGTPLNPASTTSAAYAEASSSPSESGPESAAPSSRNWRQKVYAEHAANEAYVP